MEIKFYNTATRQKEVFDPLDATNVRFYACGPTVYDFAHIGNGRSFMTFDQIYRLLRHVYGADQVTYVRNITDIDDKVMDRAKERGITIDELTEAPIRAFEEDMAALGLLPPDHQPRATAYVAQMIAMIEDLIGKGHAYVEQGHVLFEVKSMADYGKFANRSTDELLAGARVEVAPYKRDAMDFVLWKPSEEDQPGWESPWGIGRPGWHLECSVMSEQLLGETFDIHAGGVDLIFPHHQNEIAQSVCAHDQKPMANYWVHGGFLQVEGEKMSKSLGNFYTVHDLIDNWPGEALRLHMLMTHYRQSMNFSLDGVREAKAILDRWYRLTADIGAVSEADLPASVVEALADDLNSPKALAEMHRIAGEIAKSDEASSLKSQLKAAGQFFALLQMTSEDWANWRPQSAEIDEARIEALVAERNAARADKDWARADQVRNELGKMGIAIKDGPEGTTWSYEK